MKRKKQIASLFVACGAGKAEAEALANTTYTLAFYGQSQANGEAQEDFINEAIAVYLEGGDVSKALIKLKNSRSKERVSIDEQIEGDEGSFNVDIREKGNSDNDRQDWIPVAPEERMQLALDCIIAIRKTYKKIAPTRDGFQAVLRLYGRKTFLGYFKTNYARGAAERQAYKKILGWVLPVHYNTFSNTCSECGGPKSRYGVSRCKLCYTNKSRAGAH